MYLVTRPDGDLLLDPVAARADVDEVDTELLELADETLALLDAPLLPLARRGVAFRAFGPIGRTDAVEERLVPRGADARGHAEREADAVLERAAVLVRTRVRERGHELVLEVAVRAVDLDEVVCEESGLVPS